MGSVLGNGRRALADEVPVGYKRTEVGVIPEDWCVSAIGTEFRVQLGKMLDSAKNSGVPKPYIGNRSVQWGRIDVGDIDTVPMTLADLQRFRLRRGDLLVCEGGEIGRAAIWDNPIPECYYQKALHRLRPIRNYDIYLMMSLLQLWASTGYLANYVTQTSIAHLPKDKLEIVPLPVPPPAEQRAIAEVLSDVDEIALGVGGADRQEAGRQAGRHAATPHRQEPPAGVQWGLGDDNTRRSCGYKERGNAKHSDWCLLERADSVVHTDRHHSYAGEVPSTSSRRSGVSLRRDWLVVQQVCFLLALFSCAVAQLSGKSRLLHLQYVRTKVSRHLSVETMYPMSFYTTCS